MNGKRREQASPDPDPRRLNDEYRAMEASLTEYLDDKLSLLAGEGNLPRAGGGEGWFRRWRVDVYFGVTLILLLLVLWRQGLPTFGRASGTGEETAPPPDASAPAGTPESTPATPGAAAEQAPAEATPAQPPFDLAQPAAAWQVFVAGNRQQLAPWLVAVSEARGLDATQVSQMQKANFKSWAAEMVAGGEFTSAHLVSIRVGLFEYVYGRWSRGRGARWDKVDLVVNAAEYDLQLLGDLLAELGLKRWFAEPDPKDGALQAAVIITWVRNRQP